MNNLTSMTTRTLSSVPHSAVCLAGNDEVKVLKVDVLEYNHKASDGSVQSFKQVYVDTLTESKTYHDRFYTDWILVKDGELLFCVDEYGECPLDGSFEYDVLPTSPVEEIQICVNQRDLNIGNTVAKIALHALAAEFNMDTSHITITNIGF